MFIAEISGLPNEEDVVDVPFVVDYVLTKFFKEKFFKVGDIE